VLVASSRRNLLHEYTEFTYIREASYFP
jgi:hypothetical protein